MTKAPVFPLVLLLFFATLGGVYPGCKRGDESTGTDQTNKTTASPVGKPKYANPRGTLKLSSRVGNWPEAWSASEVILEDAGVPIPASQEAIEKLRAESVESDTLVLIARAAHETGRKELAIRLLQEACRNERYANAARVRQTMIGMVGLGRYYQGLSFLEDALVAQPDQFETRRWLFDFYIGADDRVSAIPHGQQLIRQRKFDIDLLIAISNTERRTLDSKPLDQMVERNPGDKRPLLGAAKAKFDENLYDEAIKLLTEITAGHPEHQPAQALLGQAYAAAGKMSDVAGWSNRQEEGIQNYPGYWIALGDWCRQSEKTESAIRCFAQGATCQDPDVVQIWTRLSTLLPEWNETSSGDARQREVLTKQVNDRANQLGRLQQLIDRFDRTGQISRAIALEIAETLQALGRLWEAEAWASVAIGLPEDDAVDVDAFRMSLVKQLRSDPPWRQGGSVPDFREALTELPLPAIERVVSTKKNTSQNPSDSAVAADQATDSAGLRVSWKMDDQAVERGINFWGRTGDQLDQPGIMLFQTLGCGGGAIDFDLDGWSDLYLVAAGGRPPESDSEPNELYRNLNGQFSAVGPSAAVDDRGFGQGVAVGDVNEDGFPDLLILNYGPNRLLINRGDGSFRDSSDLMPPGPFDEWSSSGAIADVDGDGLSDLMIVNYCATLGPVTQVCKMKDSEVFRSCTPMLFPAADDRFLKGSTDGTFSDADESWNMITETPGRGLGIIVGDMDGKRGNEIFVANDMTNNHYWSRSAQDSGQFSMTESAMLRGLGGDDRGIPQGSMGIASGDLDQDGDMDLYVTNFDKEYNTLHSQSSSGIWQDRTGARGLVKDTAPLVAFGTEAIDLNNDGQLELVVANGHVDLFSRGDEQALYSQPMQVFRRSDEGAYQSVDVRTFGGYFNSSHVGRGLWTLDANRDGMTDFAITHQTEPAALIINKTESQGNWIDLVLVGTRCSRDAIGSTVRIISGEQSRVAFRLAGDGYQCSNDATLHVGLGKANADQTTIEILWPDGMTERYIETPTRKLNTLVQGEGDRVK